MYHKEAKWGDVHWINLAEDKDKWQVGSYEHNIENKMKKFRVTHNAGNFLTSPKTVSVLKRTKADACECGNETSGSIK